MMVLFFAILSFVESQAGDRRLFFGKKSNEMIASSEISPPPYKIPPVNMNVTPLLRALLERVWVTKYFKEPSEIFKFSSSMPFCDSSFNVAMKPKVVRHPFLWDYGCLPVEIKSKVNREDLSGVLTIRVVYFNGVDDILVDTLKVIKADSLVEYKIKKEKKEIIEEGIKSVLDARSIEPPKYDIFFKTYSELEDYFYFEPWSKSLNSKDDSLVKRARINQYFIRRAKKYALTLEYHPEEFKKIDGILEYSIMAPPGFFGIEDY